VCSRPAFVTGVGGISNTVFQGDRCVPTADCDFAEHAEIAIAANECYRQAGITNPAREIQVVEMYDPFSSFQFPELESMGFCERGTAARLSDEGAFEPGGITAIGPSGGTLCTNPIGVTGLVRVADAALQVMGRAGAMQVPNVHNALATAAGGSAQFFACTLLSDEPRGPAQA
jgi:acetyl-CoA C-acetyltransferase